MNWCAVAILSVAIFFARCQAPRDKKPVKDAKETDIEKLQGTWKIVYTESSGIGFKPMNDVRVTFSDGVSTERCEGEIATKCSFSIDASKNPKVITFTILENKLIPTSKGEKSYAIYEFRGEQLVLCYGSRGSTPKEFTAPERSARRLDTHEKVRD